MDSHDNEIDMLQISKMMFLWLLEQLVYIYGIPIVLCSGPVPQFSDLFSIFQQMICLFRAVL